MNEASVMIAVYSTETRHKVRRLYVEPESCLDAAKAFYDGLGVRLVRVAAVSQVDKTPDGGKWVRWHWGPPEAAARAAIGLPPMTDAEMRRSLVLDGYAYVPPSG